MSDDDDWYDQPYTKADMLKPGFDPFEAYKAWIAKRLIPETPAEEAARIQRARKRVIAALAELEKRRLNPPPPIKVPAPPSEEERWKKALKDIKNNRQK